MATDSPSRAAIAGSSVTSVRLVLSTRAPPMRADSCTCGAGRRELVAVVEAHRLYIRIAEAPGVVEVREAIVCPQGGVPAEPVLQVPTCHGSCHAVKCGGLPAHQSAIPPDSE